MVAVSLFVTSTVLLAITTRTEYRDGDNLIIVYSQGYTVAYTPHHNHYHRDHFQKIRNEKNGETQYNAWTQTVDSYYDKEGRRVSSEADCYDRVYFGIGTGREIKAFDPKKAFDHIDTSYDDIKRGEEKEEEEFNQRPY